MRRMDEQLKKEFLKDGRIRMDREVVSWSLKMAYSMDKAGFLVWAVLYLASAVVPAVFLSLVRSVVDRIQTNIKAGQTVSSIIVLLMAMVVIMCVQSLFAKIPVLMQSVLNTRYSIAMQRQLSAFMKKVPIRFFDDEETAKLMDSAQRDTGAFGKFITFFFSWTAGLFSFVSMLILSGSTSIWLFLVMLAFLAILLPFSIRSAKKDWDSWVVTSDNARRANYYYNSIFREENAREIRILGLTGYLMRKWDKDIKDVNEKTIKAKAYAVDFSAFAQIFLSVTEFGMLFAGLILLKHGQLTLGGLTLFVSAFESAGSAASGFANDLVNTYRFSCDLKFKKLLFEMEFPPERAPLPEEAEKQPEADDILADCKRKQTIPEEHAGTAGDTGGDSRRQGSTQPPVFECRNVSFSYPNGKEILKGITFRIEKGETVALIGENGAGKSTLIKLLLGLYEPTDGELYFRGKNYRNLDKNRMMENVGAVFQDFARFDLMMRENTAFGNLAVLSDDRKITDALKKGGAGKLIGKMPEGIDSYLGRWYRRDGIRMSGGEWQRVAVSRVYVSNKDILIMDEPAAALDPIAEMEQFSQLQNSMDERTSILISHRIGFARLADKIIVLDGGHVAECGTHEALMEKQGLYCRMFNDQAKWYRQEGMEDERVHA